MAEKDYLGAAAGYKPPVIEPGYTFATITDKISTIVLSRPTSLGWLLGFGFAAVWLGALLARR